MQLKAHRILPDILGNIKYLELIPLHLPKLNHSHLVTWIVLVFSIPHFYCDTCLNIPRTCKVKQYSGLPRYFHDILVESTYISFSTSNRYDIWRIYSFYLYKFIFSFQNNFSLIQFQFRSLILSGGIFWRIVVLL